MSSQVPNNTKPGAKTGKKSNKRTRRNAQRARSEITQKSMPISTQTTIKVTEPKIVQKNGCSRITHRELIGVVQSTASSGWEITPGLGLLASGVLRANPGSQSTFPWLSSQALGYERYKFRKLHFHYIGRCPTTTFGNVMLTPDYDAADANPITESVAASNVDTKEFSAYAPSVRMVMDPKRMNRSYNSHYVMTDSRFSSTGQDSKTIDVAKVIISDDILSVVACGKLWVEYDVDLFDPQLNFQSGHAGGGTFTATTGLSSTNKPFGAALSSVTQSANPILTNLPGSASNPVPTNILGTFTAPFDGNITTLVNGAVVNGSSYIPLVNGIIPALSVIYGAIFNGTNTAGQATYGFKANNGDILSLQSLATNGGLTTLSMALGQSLI